MSPELLGKHTDICAQYLVRIYFFVVWLLDHFLFFKDISGFPGYTNDRVCVCVRLMISERVVAISFEVIL